MALVLIRIIIQCNALTRGKEMRQGSTNFHVDSAVAIIKMVIKEAEVLEDTEENRDILNRLLEHVLYHDEIGEIISMMLIQKKIHLVTIEGKKYYRLAK
jgi:hypothetical protein